MSSSSSSSSGSHETPEKSQIEHFLHDHPLISFESDEEQQGCENCDDFIFDDPIVRYSFYRHNSRVKLPTHVRNMLHPAHLLEFSGGHSFDCDACGGDFYGSRYQCILCNFNLDVSCVFEHTFEEPQGHKEHTFKILMPTLFTCDACGIEEVKKCICTCTTCQLHVHKKCTYSYPFIIKERRHNHLLNLTYSFQTSPGFADKICKICFHKMNNVLFMYCCTYCDYFTHVKCGISTNTLHDDSHVLEIEDKVFGPNNLESEETRQQQVDHFSHPHSLILNISGPKSVILCNGCVRPISQSFYSCDKCNFFLHQHCIELKEKMQHPLHVHELTLISASDNQMQIPNLYPTRRRTLTTTGIKCYGCRFLCNGFMYGCKECVFFLDIGCSLLPDILSHEGHACELTLIDIYERHNGYHPDYETKCSACGLNCLNKFVCEGCNFNLDLQCASLPKLIPHECPKHDWNLHHFELMYHSVDDGRSGEYYCDVCEEERNENHWFYYCRDCDYSAHPRCILGCDRVKYGSLHKIEDHPHFVRLLKTANGKYTCEICLQPCEKDQPVYRCEECNAHLHFFCSSLFYRLQEIEFRIS